MSEQEDKEKSEAIVWVSKPCAICAKPVTVMSTHAGDTWCLEHAGTWKEPPTGGEQ